MSKRKKKITFVVVIILLVIGSLVAFRYTDDFKNYLYLKSDDITEDMIKDKDSYLKQKETEYFVYFYDNETCKKCVENIENLKKYETNTKDNILKKIYKVNLKNLDKEIVENYLFLNNENGNLYYIKKGKKEFQLTTNNVPYDFLENVEEYINY